MFYYNQDSLFCDGLSVRAISKQAQTPFYLYSLNSIERNVRTIKEVLGSRATLYYALKANSNVALVTKIASLGLGVDVVSGGEIEVALECGVKPADIVFAGVGKSDDEIRLALRKRVKSLHAESFQELEVINGIAQSMACIVPVALRINPDIDIHGHPYIVTGKAAVKFGIDVPTVLNILKNESQFTNLRFIGFHIHLGSQIFDISYYQKSVVLLLEMKIAARHLGVNIEYVDIGGGLGVDYELEIPEQQDGDQIGMRSIEVLRFLASELDSMDCEVIFEPGRSLVANAGILVARVLYKKEASGKRFAILDAGMTDLIRPSLYGAYHRVAPVERVPERGEEVIDLVGPICETGDFLARDRNMQRLQRGDLVAVMTAGAYGYVLSSNYNERKRPAEIVVENNSFRVVTVAR